MRIGIVLSIIRSSSASNYTRVTSIACGRSSIISPTSWQPSGLQQRYSTSTSTTTLPSPISATTATAPNVANVTEESAQLGKQNEDLDSDDRRLRWSEISAQDFLHVLKSTKEEEVEPAEASDTIERIKKKTKKKSRKIKASDPKGEDAVDSKRSRKIKDDRSTSISTQSRERAPVKHDQVESDTLDTTATAASYQRPKKQLPKDSFPSKASVPKESSSSSAPMKVSATVSTTPTPKARAPLPTTYLVSPFFAHLLEPPQPPPTTTCHPSLYTLFSTPPPTPSELHHTLQSLQTHPEHPLITLTYQHWAYLIRIFFPRLPPPDLNNNNRHPTSSIVEKTTPVRIHYTLTALHILKKTGVQPNIPICSSLVLSLADKPGGRKWADGVHVYVTRRSEKNWVNVKDSEWDSYFLHLITFLRFWRVASEEGGGVTVFKAWEDLKQLRFKPSIPTLLGFLESFALEKSESELKEVQRYLVGGVRALDAEKKEECSVIAWEAIMKARNDVEDWEGVTRVMEGFARQSVPSVAMCKLYLQALSKLDFHPKVLRSYSTLREKFGLELDDNIAELLLKSIVNSSMDTAETLDLITELIHNPLQSTLLPNKRAELPPSPTISPASENLTQRSYIPLIAAYSTLNTLHPLLLAHSEFKILRSSLPKDSAILNRVPRKTLANVLYTLSKNSPTLSPVKSFFLRECLNDDERLKHHWLKISKGFEARMAREIARCEERIRVNVLPSPDLKKKKGSVRDFEIRKAAAESRKLKSALRRGVLIRVGRDGPFGVCYEAVERGWREKVDAEVERRLERGEDLHERGEMLMNLEDLVREFKEVEAGSVERVMGVCGVRCFRYKEGMKRPVDGGEEEEGKIGDEEEDLGLEWEDEGENEKEDNQGKP
ncbi:hypothetical protein HDV05_003459 [Chytridiales sp. JEL 0842]|nr:hypothetical protein HDV05_003459 [Chytridiales sp. JEL 0842]